MPQHEAIYKGATRPAMKFGVPLVPLVLLLGGGVLAAMWAGILLTWWLALAVVLAVLPTLGWMRHATRQDDQRFRQLFVLARLRLQDHNRHLWQARSYSPTLYRGASDGWHR